MATENTQKQTQSTSTAALSAPTVAGSTAQGLDSHARRIVDAALSSVSKAGSGDSDFALRQGIDQLSSQIGAIKDTKGLIGLGALQSLGDLRNKVFENERERRIKQAEGGFAGGTQAVASQKAFNERIGASENALETDFLNKERSQNLQLAQFQNAQLDQLKGTNAFTKELAREVVRRKEAGLGDATSLTHDQGFWGEGVGAFFGKDQTYTGHLDKTKFAQDAYFKDLLSEMGINVNDAALQDKIDKAMNSVYNRYVEKGAFAITRQDKINKDLGMSADELKNLYKK